MKAPHEGFTHWSRFEQVWFIAFLSIVVLATVYYSVSGTDYNSAESVLLNWVISPLSAITGILCVVLAAKGRLSTWAYGIVNSALYGYIAFRTGYYGDAIINIVYFLPTQFIGLLFWKTRLKTRSDVRKRRLTARQSVAIIAIGLAATIVFGLFLHSVDSWFTDVMKRNVSIYGHLEEVLGPRAALIGPMLDSATEVTQLLGQLLMVLAYSQQWLFWFITDVITVAMWVAVLVADPSSVSWALPTLVMWVAYLVNSVYGWITWEKGALHDESA